MKIVTQRDAEAIRQRQLEIGPHRTGLRECRPYFLAPLLDVASAEATSTTSTARDRIKQQIERAASAMKEEGQPVTDLYILSHGWHRNLFGAVAAYDRLVSRLAALNHRKRLKPPHPYNPLFITLHWHSDLGQDNWEDSQGRRDKASFMLNARQAFRNGYDKGRNRKPSDADFANDFENIYELFSSVSAPDTLILDSQYTDKADKGFEALESYRFRDSDDAVPDATLAEKTAMAWRCYDEAQPKGVLLDQAAAPQPYNNPGQALVLIFKFLISTLGVFAVLGMLYKNWQAVYGVLAWLCRWLIGLPIISTIWNQVLQPIVSLIWIRCLGSIERWIIGIERAGLRYFVILTMLLALCGLILRVTIGLKYYHRKRAKKEGRASKGRRPAGPPILQVIAWLPLQLVFTLPLVAWSLVGYLVGWVFYKLSSGRSRLTFDERYGPTDRKRLPRDYLSTIARLPLNLFKATLDKDSQLMPLVDTFANQLAFWEMQRKGVNAGKEAGGFIADLITHPAFCGVRLHLIGHSFGGLVVSNAARYLANEKPCGQPLDGRLQTLCLVQGALASDWFDQEDELAARIKSANGTLGCIYSVYDTANGFYYPLANNGRMSAGFVGMYRVAHQNNVMSLGEGGLFASLVTPPDLKQEIQQEETADASLCYHHTLNLDASRLIYQGPPAAGGGHDDIFKDDVIHLIWAISTLTM